MARLLPISAAVLLAACSSGSTTTPTTPSATPASDAVQSGGGQQAEPGDTLPVRPSVIVRSAAGIPVSGVSVTFAVDSGGGSLSVSSATTGSNGVATAGIWTLGAAEGRNVLTVTAGTLAPLAVVATAVVQGGNFPTATISASGGAVTVTQPGPLNGFNLAIPASAFSTSTQWTVSYSSATTLPSGPGINPVSPLILLTSSTGAYAGSGLTLTVPAVVPAGLVPFLVLRDPVSGNLEVLATTVTSPTTVSATTFHLNGANLPSVRTQVSRTHGPTLRLGYSVQVFVSALTTAQLSQDYDTQFRPGVDDWEFHNPGTMPEIGGVCAGMAVTTMWYYLNERQTQGTLFNHFQSASGVEYSDQIGIHWASAVQGIQNDDAFNAYANTIIRGNTNRDQDFYNVLKAQMLVTGLPQLVVPYVPATENAHAVVAYKSVGDKIYVADPNDPGGLTDVVQFDAGSFAPYTTVDPDNPTATPFTRFITIGLSQFVPLDAVGALWPGVLDGTVGASLFPAYDLHTKYGTIPRRVQDTVYVQDTLRLWVECPTCQPKVTSPSAPEAVGSIAQLDLYSRSAATWKVSGANFLVGNLQAPSKPGVFTLGLVISGAVAAGTTNGNADFALLDWRPFVQLTLGAAVTPAAALGLPGAPINFSTQSTGPPPSHVIYRWNFGDSTAVVSVNDNANVQHTYAAVGNYTVTMQLLDASDQQPIVIGTTTDTIHTPPIWRFTSVGQTSETGPSPVTPLNTIFANFDATTLSAAKASMSQIVTTPSDGLLLYLGADYRTIIGPVPNTNNDVVQLQLAATAGTGSTITRLASSGVTGYQLGFCAGTNCTSGPAGTFITGTGTELSGALSGLGIQQGFPFCVGAQFCAPLIVGNWNWWQMSTTKAGTTMSGTITYTQMMSNDSTTRFVGAHVVTWNFSAAMVP